MLGMGCDRKQLSARQVSVRPRRIVNVTDPSAVPRRKAIYFLSGRPDYCLKKRQID
jgi:hypothetical protein